MPSSTRSARLPARSRSGIDRKRAAARRVPDRAIVGSPSPPRRLPGKRMANGPILPLLPRITGHYAKRLHAICLPDLFSE